MVSGITTTGFDEAIKMLENMQIDDFMENKLLNQCKPFVEEIKKNQKIRTGSQYKGWKGSVRKIDGAKNFIISNDDFSYIFEEWGTSISKHNTGYVERAINSKIEEVKNSMIDVIESELK